MHNKRLHRKNAIYTPRSGTTILVNYDAAKHILEVEFIDGRVYHYIDVPAPIWKEYQLAVKAGGSSGTFVNKQVKPFYKVKEIV